MEGKRLSSLSRRGGKFEGKKVEGEKLNDGSSCCFFVGHFLQNCRFVPPKKTAASARSKSVSSRSI